MILKISLYLSENFEWLEYIRKNKINMFDTDCNMFGFLKMRVPPRHPFKIRFSNYKPSILEIPHGHHPTRTRERAYAETIDQEASLRPTGEIPVLVTQFLFTQHLWFASPRLNKYYCILIYTNHTTLDRK